MVNAGTWIAVVAGYCFDRHGPKRASLAGASLICLGYLLLYLATTGDEKSMMTDYYKEGKRCR